MKMRVKSRSRDISKRVFVTSVVLLMLILCISSATASSTAVSIGSADTIVGESVTLPLMIGNADDEVSCATIVLSYDSAIAKVTFVDDSNSGFDSLVYNPDNVQGKTTIVVYQTGAEGLTGNIKIADVTIKAIGVGSSPLDLEIKTLKNNVGNTASADVISGSFTVKSSDGSGGNGWAGGNGGSGRSTPTPTPTPTPSPSPSPSPSPTPSANETISPGPSPSPSSQSEERGELVNITIMIKGVGGEGLSSALINLTYDPKVVKVISVGNSDFDMFMPNIGKGIVRMVGFQTGAEGLKDGVLFAELQVKAVGKVNESSELTLEIKELTDNVGKELNEHEDFEVENGFFSITGDERKTEALSSAIWIWGAVGVVLLVVAIAGVRQYKRKKKRQ